MTATLLREVPASNDKSLQRQDLRLVELVMSLSGCTARRAIDLVQSDSTGTPLHRVAMALVTIRANAQSARASGG